jgi:hypothetical protein
MRKFLGYASLAAMFALAACSPTTPPPGGMQGGDGQGAEKPKAPVVVVPEAPPAVAPVKKHHAVAPVKKPVTHVAPAVVVPLVPAARPSPRPADAGLAPPK